MKRFRNLVAQSISSIAQSSVFLPSRFNRSTSTDFVDIDAPRTATSIDSEIGVRRNVVPLVDPTKVTRLGLLIDQPVPEEQVESDETTLESAAGAESTEGDLPYDDAEFADAVLEMEVEGAIDETWQDHGKAYLEDVKEISKILKSMRVRDICAVDTSAKTSSFDYMMFGTCEGSRHIHLSAWAVQESDRVHRISKVKRRRTDETWDVVPVGRILVNLMTESVRSDLSLERKWVVTASMDPLQFANSPVSEGRQTKAHGLWTLTLNLQDLEDFEVDYCKDTLLRQR